MTNRRDHLLPEPDEDPSRPYSADQHHMIGVNRLVSNQPDATELVKQAIVKDSRRAAAYVALPCALSLEEQAEQAVASAKEAPKHLGRASRPERQQFEILTALLEDRLPHALDLAFEHFAEFGVDPLVVNLLSSRVDDQLNPELSAELGALLDRTTKERPVSCQEDGSA